MKEPVIAIINDDCDFLEMLEHAIELERPYTVVVARKGDGAIDMLLDQKPDVVVLDIRMERPQSGRCVLKAIRLNDELKDLPVIVCTADSKFLVENRDWLKELDSEWLEKPFDLDELMERIDRAVAREDIAVES